MLLAHSSFVPVPKSATTIFKLRQHINNARDPSLEAEPNALPSFEEDIIPINAAQRGKLFPTAVDAERRGEQPTCALNLPALAYWLLSGAVVLYAIGGLSETDPFFFNASFWLLTAGLVACLAGVSGGTRPNLFFLAVR